MSKLGDLGGRLYRGEVSYEIVGQRKRWYIVSAVLIALALAGLLFSRLNLGIEFKGGAEFVVPSTSCTIPDVRESLSSDGVEGALVTQLGEDRVRAQTPALSAEEAKSVLEGLSQTCDVAVDEIRVQLVGPTWGQEITKKALLGLVVFIGAVVIFLSVYFQWQMAVAAIVALLHDLVITVGLYALVGFEVTPATVIGVLTILGYSLYDTVVVFDKVKENTAGISGQSQYTYSEAANLAVNQTLVRSLNTSVVALLPVAAILFVGAGLLGAGTLKDLALALFVGIAVGTYSSIFIATPIVCQLKERSPAMKALSERVHRRRAARQGSAVAANAGVGDGRQVAAGGTGVATATAAADRPHRQHRQAGQRNQPKRTPRSKR